MNIGDFVRFCSAIIIDLYGLLFLVLQIFGEKFFRLFISRRLKSLDGEIILVTGTGNGIGRQIVLKLAEVAPTATIICWDYEQKHNEAIVDELKRKNVKVYGFILDVSDQEMVARTAAKVKILKIREEIGDVTMIFNNAGICPAGKFLEQDLDSMTRVYEINLFAHFWILREFMPKMIEKNYGHIVTTASMSSFVPAREMAVYGASKHAVHGFIESFKSELRSLPVKPNIYFSTVYPVYCQTRLLEGIQVAPRFDFLLPTITPEYVADKTIDGVRRNYEHIILPPHAELGAFGKALLPTAIWDRIEDVFVNFDIKFLNVVPSYNRNGVDKVVRKPVENGTMVNGMDHADELENSDADGEE